MSHYMIKNNFKNYVKLFESLNLENLNKYSTGQNPVPGSHPRYRVRVLQGLRQVLWVDARSTGRRICLQTSIAVCKAAGSQSVPNE